MEWYDLLKEMVEEVRLLQAIVGLKHPVNPEAKTVDAAFAEAVALEKANCLKVDELCIRYIKAGRKAWPSPTDNELYFITMRCLHASRLAAALSTNTLSRPNQRAIPFLEDSADNQIEWLLVVSWDVMGREWWKAMIELDFYRDKRRQDGR